MASYTYYELDLDVVLDPDVVNNNDGMLYFAWMIGIDSRRQKGMWLIEPLLSETDAVVTILSGDYTSGVLKDDVTRYGYTRTALLTLSITKLISEFTTELNIKKAVVA